MSEALRQVQDELAVIRTINELFTGTDRREWDKVRQLFADRVQFDMTSLTGGNPSVMSPQEIVNRWDQGLRDITGIHHQSGNFIIDLNGEKASASCYGIAIHYLPNASQRNTRTFVGSYDFELVRVQERWKIATFRFNLKFIDGNRDLK